MLSRRYYHTSIMMPRCVVRLIGSSRREGLHDVIVLNERHLHRVLASSIDYDHTCRAHWFFNMGAVARRPVHRPELGLLRVMPTVGVSRHDERLAMGAASLDIWRGQLARRVGIGTSLGDGGKGKVEGVRK